MSAPAPRAELIPDRGEAAGGPEFFRSPEFLAAEGATHTLRIEVGDGTELLAPLIVRDVPGSSGGASGPDRDAVSPYGFPGLVPRGKAFLPPSRKSSATHAGEHATTTGPPPLDPDVIDFSATGLVSVFLRHALGPAPLTGASERNIVQIADPAPPPKSRPSDRRQVRRNLEAGYELSLVPGPETAPDQRAAFLALYTQTMRRAAAAEHYFFDAAYFDRILAAERTWLALARAPGGEPAAASIAAVSDGYLHYYLSGSADAHLRDSPMKNVLALLIDHAAELSLPLNLGGGLTPGDALEEFKRGFANRSEPWLTSELICDPTKYELLSKDKPPTTFFPVYRS